MGAQIRFLGERTRNSYWFLPTVMLLGAAGFAWVTTNLDEDFDPQKLPWIGEFIYSGTTDGAREVLGTIAASMITVAGVVFSITIVSLQLASTQFGPRMLANFMRDRGNQLTLGTFVAAFLYSLLVLRGIRSDKAVDVPHLSVTFAVGLAVAGLAVLIYFIHHIATGIQAPNLVAAIARELRDGVDHLFPDVQESDDVRPASRSAHLPEDFAESATGAAPREAGYIQVVDVVALTKLAREHDLVIRLDRRPGRFVVPQSPFAYAAPAARVSDDVTAAISAAVVTGARRTSQDDIEFPIRQLVEIAVRALSPAINDPFTASTCVDQVGAGLCLLADRRFPSPSLEDEGGVLRVVHADPITFERLVSAAFEQIRQAASLHTAVYLHLLEALTRLARCVRDPERMEVVRREAGLVREAAEGRVVQAADRKVVEHRFARFEEAAGAATV
jgi:uncharacterized membrane protein